MIHFSLFMKLKCSSLQFQHNLQFQNQFIFELLGVAWVYSQKIHKLYVPNCTTLYNELHLYLKLDCLFCFVWYAEISKNHEVSSNVLGTIGKFLERSVLFLVTIKVTELFSVRIFDDRIPWTWNFYWRWLIWLYFYPLIFEN